MLVRLRIAFSFLTIFPVGGHIDYDARQLTGSAMWFPLVGWVLGALLTACAWLAIAVGMTPMVAAVIMVTVGVLLTRGLHLDGVADLLDGLGGSFDRVRRLEIMKDSFIGPFGVAGLVLLLLGKVAVLAMAIGSSSEDLLAIMVVPAAARWAMVALAYKSSYPRETGTGHPFVGSISESVLIGAALLVMPFLYAGWFGMAMVLGAQLPALWLRQKAHQAFGGVTGDVLGASCEFGELTGWLAGAFYLGVMS